MTARTVSNRGSGCTESQMQSVERALQVRTIASLDYRVRSDEAGSTTLSELIADPNNQPSLDDLDWQIAAESLDRALDPTEQLHDLFRRRVVNQETIKSLALENNLCRETLRKEIATLREEKREELADQRVFGGMIDPKSTKLSIGFHQQDR